MEIVIGVLVVGLLAAVGLSFKFLTDESKEKTKTDDAKAKRITDLEAELGRKDQELKKSLGEIQRIEDAYYQAKNDVDIAKKESSELAVRLKQTERSKDDQGQAKDELKQKSMLLEQETVARQKLQGEITMREMELEKLEKKLAEAEAQVKAKTQMYEGLKGQFAELEAELQKGPAKPKSPETGDKPPEPPKPQPPKPEPPKPEPPKPEPPKPQPPKPEPPKPEPPKPEPPETGGPGVGFTKEELKKGVPSDTDFLKAKPAPKPEGPAADVPEGTFKITNVNKPAPPKDEDKDKEKKKPKSNRETLIPGFQPKEKRLPEEP